MSIARPIERDLRSIDLDAAPGQTVFSLPATTPIWDPVDVVVSKKIAPGRAFVKQTVGFNIIVSGAIVPQATVTFTAPPRPTLGDPVVKIRLRSQRAEERKDDVTRGGRISSALLEKNLDRLSTLFQEMRRDLDDALGRSVLAADGEPGHLLPAPADLPGKNLGFNLLGQMIATPSVGQIPGVASISDAMIATPPTAAQGINPEKLWFLQSGGGARYLSLLSRLREGISLEHFDGFNRDDADDNLAAFNACKAACIAARREMRIPGGYYRSSGTWDATGIGRINAEGAVLRPQMDAGVGMRWLAPSGEFIERPELQGDFMVAWPTRDYTKERWGFLFSNVYSGTFHFSVVNATLGALLYGNNKGVVHNHFWPKLVAECQKGITLLSASGSGWVNGNEIHGGMFTNNAADVGAGIYGAEACHIHVIGSPYLNNGNHFIRPSLERIGPDFKLARVGGLMNRVDLRYSEMDNPQGTPAAGFWVVDTGERTIWDVFGAPYILGDDRIDISGATNPCILGYRGHLDMGSVGGQIYKNAHASRPTVQMENSGGGRALKVVGGMDIAGRIGGSKQVAHAWLNWSLSGGAFASVAQENINLGSTSRVSAGKTEVTFATPFADANYAVIGSAHNDGSNQTQVSIDSTAAKTANGCTLLSFMAGTGLVDSPVNHAMFIGTPAA